MSGDNYLEISSTGIGYQEKKSAQTSSGASPGQLVALNASSVVDSTLLPAISATYTQRTDTASFSALYNHLEQVDLATAGANVTCTLPSAATSSGQGLLVQVITVSATHHVVFATVSSQTINGATASSLPTIAAVDQTYFFISDGTNWWTVSPVVNLANNTTGILPTASGGTGANNTATDGHLLVGSTAGGDYLDAAPTSSDSTVTWTLGAGTLSAQVNQSNLVLSSIGGSLNLATQVTGILPVLNGPSAVTATAGSTNITAGALIYIDTGGLIQLASNAASSTAATGYAPSAITATLSGTVIIGNGPNAGVTGLSVGVQYLLGTAGGTTTTVPTGTGVIVQPVGFAKTASLLEVILGPYTIRA